MTLIEYINYCTTDSQTVKYDRLSHRMTKVVMIDNRKKHIHNYIEYKQNMLHKLDI